MAQTIAVKSNDDDNPISNSSGSSDSSDDDDDASMMYVKKAEELKHEVQQNPLQYDKHVELIKTLRKAGELDDLREAHEKMSKLFPLSPEIWLLWIKEEIKFGESQENIINLFERAVQDYVSFDLWLEYCLWAIGGLGGLSTPEKVRPIFERAVTTVGLQANSGCLLWGAYRDFETSLLNSIQPTPGSVESEIEQKRVTEQWTRVDALFRRNLLLPLQGIESVCKEYKEFLGLADDASLPDANLSKKYSWALDRLSVLTPLEAKLGAENTESPLSAYLAYVNQEQKWGDPGRICLAFERAITQHPVNNKLWLRYLEYLDKDLRVHDVILQVYARAVRNCPWIGCIWEQYMLSLERADKPWEEIVSVFDAARDSGFSNAYEGVALWLTYIYSLRRSLFKSASESWHLVEQAFEQGAEHLKTNFGQFDWDESMSYRRAWAYFVASKRNTGKMREIWADLLKDGNGRFASLWLDYLAVERRFGTVPQTRKLLFQAVNSVMDYPEQVCAVLIQFEKEEGSLSDLDAALDRVQAQMKRVEARNTKLEEKKMKQTTKKKDPSSLHKPSVISYSNAVQPDPNRSRHQHESRKRSLPSDDVTHTPSPEVTSPGEQKDSDGFLVPSIPCKRPRPATALSPNVSALSSGTNGEMVSKPGPPETSSMVANIPNKTGLKDSGASKDTAVGLKCSTDPELRACTVFVSNLDYKVMEDRLTKLFNAVGKVKDVRLTRRGNRSRGFGYVEMSTPAEALAAISALDRQEIDGRPMYVSIYEEERSKRPIKYDVGLNKAKLFVRHLPPDATHADVVNLYKDFAGFKEARLVTSKAGKTKCIAYVDFVDDKSASHALMKTDGTVFRGQLLNVAISNPPARSNLLPDPGLRKRKVDLPGGYSAKKGDIPISAARVDSSVRPSESVENDPDLSHSETSSVVTTSSDISQKKDTAKMSNDQFRQLFFKK